jgi:hypothetical protein
VYKDKARFTEMPHMEQQRKLLATGVVCADVSKNGDWTLDDGHIVKKLLAETRKCSLT